MQEQLKQESYEDGDLDLLEYQLQEVNQELTWQHQVTEIDKLETKKRELEEKIKNLKNNDMVS